MRKLKLIKQKINKSINRAIDFLLKSQLPYGEFPSYCTNVMEGGRWTFDSSVFITALIVYSLRFIKDKRAFLMREKAEEFLLSEKLPGGLWQYWSSKNTKKIDPDLDDTCCAGEIVKEKDPFVYVNNLFTILDCRNRDGIFYTWIAKKDEENDIDSVVNANVLFYLQNFYGIEKVADYLYDIILHNREEESYYYYLSPGALYYMISRAYENGAEALTICGEIIKKKILEKRLDLSGNEQELSLDICSILNFKFEAFYLLDPAVDRILKCQRKDGSWNRYAFAAGPPPPGPVSVWFGSEMLTTAFCLEALAKYLPCLSSSRSDVLQDKLLQ